MYLLLLLCYYVIVIIVIVIISFQPCFFPNFHLDLIPSPKERWDPSPHCTHHSPAPGAHLVPPPPPSMQRLPAAPVLCMEGRGRVPRSPLSWVRACWEGKSATEQTIFSLTGFTFSTRPHKNKLTKQRTQN